MAVQGLPPEWRWVTPGELELNAGAAGTVEGAIVANRVEKRDYKMTVEVSGAGERLAIPLTLVGTM